MSVTWTPISTSRDPDSLDHLRAARAGLEQALAELDLATEKLSGADPSGESIGEIKSKAAEALAGEGISVEVVDPRTLVPFDEATLVASVRKTGRLLVVDECHMRCSVGSEIVASVVEQAWGDLKAAPRRVATDDVPVPYSEPLERAISPTIDKITAAAKSLMGG